jgi:hypothetical protein
MRFIKVHDLIDRFKVKLLHNAHAKKQKRPTAAGGGYRGCIGLGGLAFQVRGQASQPAIGGC